MFILLGIVVFWRRLASFLLCKGTKKAGKPQKEDIFFTCLLALLGL